MLGDSLTAGNNWSKSFSGLKIKNMGLNGDTCAGLWNRLSQVVELAPDKIFLMIGINDLLQGAGAEEIVTSHVRIWEEIKKKLPRATVHILSLIPYLEASLPGLIPNFDIREINLSLADEAKKYELIFIPLFQDLADFDLQLQLQYTIDGVHLTPLAYQVWEDRLKPFLLA